QQIAVREAARLEVTTNAGNAKIGYSFAIAPTSTNVGLPTVAARGKARQRRSADAITENSAISIFARSTANITAGEHAANASTTPAPSVTRPASNTNVTNIVVTNPTPMTM